MGPQRKLDISFSNSSRYTNSTEIEYQQDSELGTPELSQLESFTTTPIIKNVDKPKTRLFHNPTIDEPEIEIVPTETDLEFLLVNSCTINAIKVQTIVENFIRGKKHTSIFCMTETKVDSHNFEPRGIKMFSLHRSKGEKRRGGLAIGFDKKADIKLEKLKTNSNDILALEGTVLKTKFRFVLCYFDSTKLVNGPDYEKNRSIYQL